MKINFWKNKIVERQNQYTKSRTNAIGKQRGPRGKSKRKAFYPPLAEYPTTGGAFGFRTDRSPTANSIETSEIHKRSISYPGCTKTPPLVLGGICSLQIAPAAHSSFTQANRNRTSQHTARSLAHSTQCWTKEAEPSLCLLRSLQLSPRHSS